jgi:hypothetical protein
MVVVVPLLVFASSLLPIAENGEKSDNVVINIAISVKYLAVLVAIPCSTHNDMLKLLFCIYGFS